MPEGTEFGDKVTDIAQLYSDTIYILGFKELYQRLEEGKKKVASDKFEWDTDYFKVIDENDVNFLLDTEDTTSDSEDTCSNDDELTENIINDNMFADDLVSSPTSESVNGLATPTTPSSSRSISRTVSMTGMGRSRSASSLSLNSTASIPTSQPNNNAPKLPLFLREQDVNYQYYRQTLFSELLRQYPASRKEILHHAKVDIPPLLRGKVWAAVLGVRGDLEYDYDQIDKIVDNGEDKQVIKG
jgi:hypothetical protein